MTKKSTSPANSKWTGMVAVDDTALAVTDTGPGVPVVYLNVIQASIMYSARRCDSR